MSIEVTPKPTPTALNTNIPVSAATLPIDGSNSASSMYKMAWGPELNNAGFMLRLLGHGSGFPGQGQWPESESGFVGDHVLNLSLSFFLALQEKSKLPQIPDISSVLVSGDTLAAPQTPISSSLGSTHNEPFTGPDAADISLSSGS